MAVSGDPLLWFGTLVLAAATVVTVVAASRHGDAATRLAVAPPLVGTVVYLLALLGVGGTGGGLALSRSAGWVLTAPLLLAVLGLVGRATGSALWGAMASAAAMGLAGLALVVVEFSNTATLGGLAVVWLGAVVSLAVLFRPLSHRAGLAGDKRAQLFSMLRNVVPLAFVGYALVVTLAPVGLDLVGAGAASAGLLVFDLLGTGVIPVVLARNVALLD